MFKNIQQAKKYIPTEIYELINHIEFDEFLLKRPDNKGDVWKIIKNEKGIDIYFEGKQVKKLNWWERFRNEFKQF